MSRSVRVKRVRQARLSLVFLGAGCSSRWIRVWFCVSLRTKKASYYIIKQSLVDAWHQARMRGDQPVKLLVFALDVCGRFRARVEISESM